MRGLREPLDRRARRSRGLEEMTWSKHRW